MEVDEALTKLGRYSKWQMYKYALLSASVTIPGAWQMMVFVFIAAEPPHNCHLPANFTREEYIPRELRNGKLEWSQCKRYTNLTEGNVTEWCTDSFDYDESYGSTIVTDWTLVCSRSALAGTVQSVFSGGVLVGALFFTWLADRYGRKPVHLGTQYALAICGTICAFLPDYTAFVAFTFIRGAIREGAGLTGIVMMTELFPSGERTFAGTAFEVMWALAWIFLALLGYLIRNWRHLMLIISLIPLFTISYIWLLPESVIWLMTNNRIDEAEKILRNAAKFNGVEMPDKILKRPRQRRPSQRFSVLSVEGPYQCSILDIFKSKLMLTNAVIMFLLWFCDTMVYYALSLSTSLLAGDRFLNFALSGLVEIPAYVVPIYVLKRFGRRKPIFIFHLIAGLGLGIAIFIPEKTAGGTDLSPLIITFVMLGKFGITASFSSVVLYAPEIFPTNVRNFCFGISSMGGRIGGMLSPFYGLLAKEIVWLPGLLCGTLSIASGLLVFALPETVDKPLPNTIRDIENWRKEVKISKKKDIVKNGETEGGVTDQML